MSKISAIRIPESDSRDGSPQPALCQDRDEGSESQRPSIHDGVGEGGKCNPAGGREPTGRHSTPSMETVCGASGNHGNSDVDESLHLRSGREPTGKFHVDIWSSSIPSRLSSIEAELSQQKDLLFKKKDSLCTYIMRSAKSRLKLARSEEIQSVLDVLHLEVAIATARNRPDLIENLLARRAEILSLANHIILLEQEEYQLRFDLKS